MEGMIPEPIRLCKNILIISVSCNFRHDNIIAGENLSQGAVECSERPAPATACGETSQPLSTERLLQFTSCEIPLSRVYGFHENNN
jgi:hypothetical protein